MKHHRQFRYYSILLTVLLPFPLIAQPFFDTHLHYTANDAQRYSPKEILRRLDANNVMYAAVTRVSPTYTRQLYQAAPDRIVPLLAPERDKANKTEWIYNRNLITFLEKELENDYWRGIGELHVFARDRHSKVFEKIVALASEKQLPLLIHGDPAVIDRIYELAPRQPVIWAHAGTFPYTDLIMDYLRRYPHLLIDLSMRDERIAPGGEIDDNWYELFVTFPDRFMVGVDTYSTERWDKYDSAVETIRSWLEQLPTDIAMQLAYTNAARLYKKRLSIKGDREIIN